MRPISLLLGLALLATSTASGRAEDRPQRCGRDAPFLGLDGLDAFSAGDRDPGRLQPLAELGPLLVRSRPIPWGRIEARPPRHGPPAYVWKPLDEAVLLWGLAGMAPVLVLSPRSPWACTARGTTDWERTVKAKLEGPEAQAALRDVTGTPPPRADAWYHWERFVRDLVERYDGDGQEDMPGLRQPLRGIQVLGHAASPDIWLGSAEEYMRLLHHAGVGAKSAHADTCVVAATVDVRATGHEPYPDEREWSHRIGQLAPRESTLAALEVERAFAFLRGLLVMPRLFDVLPQAGSDSHPDDEANLRFLRRTLDARQGGDVALWLVANPSRKLGLARIPGVVVPKEEELRLRRRWELPALNPAHSEHVKALRWLRRGQAFDLVRSLARARAAGADVVLFRGPWDHAAGRHLPDESSRLQGLLAEDPDAPPSEPPRRTSSFHALAQANRLLGGHRSAGATTLGAPGRSVVFTFKNRPGRPWVALLLLDERLSWAGVPGEALAPRKVTVPLPSGRYLLEDCRLGEADPRRRTVVVTDGMIDLDLTPAPVYVVPTD